MKPAKNQVDLFDRGISEPLHIQARDEAMKAVEDKAERVSPEFTSRACAYVLEYLRRHGPTAGEELTDLCKAAGIEPHDDRAFGPVYMRLSRDKLIEQVGVTQRKKGHGTSGGKIWALKRPASDQPG